MNDSLEQLALDVSRLTGSEIPSILQPDAPVLASEDEDLYLIGLIGGKEVGKSSFVNAVIGRPVTEVSAHGRGTHEVTAYAHASRRAAVEELLSREAAGRYRIVEHDIAELGRQVLLDLPDIDSIYDDHIELTRRLLRHMLFPIWITSFDKYADQHPQQLLLRVAEGNDPENFIFCINKNDLLVAKFGDAAAEELRADYQQRLMKLLNLPSIDVHLVSAAEPQRFEFPQLRQTLSKQKSERVVHQSRELARQQRDRTLLAWIENQNLPQHQQRAARLRDQADEMLMSRVVQPILEQAIPKLTSDPAHRLGMIEPVLNRRLARWPVVNVIQAMLSPLTMLIRQNVATTGRSGDLSEYLVDPPATALASSFAMLQQSQPVTAQLYQANKLWEPMQSDAAVQSLNHRIASALDRQKQALMDRLSGDGFCSAILRWSLTIGAILWFPILQPICEGLLQETLTGSAQKFLLLLVKTFSVAYLLQQAVFLLIYFLSLWAILRWQTHSRVSRLLDRWSESIEDPQLSLQQQVIEWMDELLEPMNAHSERVEALASRYERFRESLRSRSAA